MQNLTHWVPEHMTLPQQKRVQPQPSSYPAGLCIVCRLGLLFTKDESAPQADARTVPRVVRLCGTMYLVILVSACCIGGWPTEMAQYKLTVSIMKFL